MAVTSASVAANPEVRLGTVLTVELLDQGTQEWIYVHNAGSTDFAEGEAVMRDTTSRTYEVVHTPASSITLGMRVVGIAQHAIPADQYGFVLKRGIGKVLVGSGAGVSDVDSLTSGGAQVGSVLVKANSATAAASTIALAVQAIAASGKGFAFIDCRG